MKYYVRNIIEIFDEDTEIEAKSPLEAVRKLYPNKQVKRDKHGRIVVYGCCNTRYGTFNKGRSYVYSVI